MQDIIKPIDRALLKAELTGDKKLRLSLIHIYATAIQGQHIRSVIGIIFRSQVRSDRFGQKGIHS